jgi:hypothetical protein
MQKIVIILYFLLTHALYAQHYDMQTVAEIDLGTALGQFRAVPVNFKDGTRAIAAMYSETAEIDPYIGMFFFPKHTLKIILFSEEGDIIWKRDLGPGVVPGIWFSPILAFDLDQDDNDEIWIVNNLDPDHPLDYRQFVIEKVDPRTGETLGQWPWLQPSPRQTMSHLYRHFLMGAHIHGTPVLVAGQGTYGDMYIQAWNADMDLRWKLEIPEDEAGAKGSHVTPVVDINNDGVDDLLWGERCIELDKGTQLFCADEKMWNGHSDIIQPVYDYTKNTWFFFTCRESHNDQSPRIVMYDHHGNRVWGDLDQGHIDTGWAARIGKDGSPIILGVKVGEKVRTAEGERRTGIVENTYEAFSGEKINLGFEVYTSIPVDVNGDGTHELVKGYFEGDGSLLDRNGKRIGNIGGLVAMASKFTKYPGEQILSYSKDGKVRIWADKNAEDNDKAKARYANPFYKINQIQTGNGYNLFTLGGI